MHVNIDWYMVNCLDPMSNIDDVLSFAGDKITLEWTKRPFFIDQIGGFCSIFAMTSSALF